MRRDDTFEPRLIATTAELEEAWNDREEWGASGPLLIEDDEEWIITGDERGYTLSRVADDGTSYVAFPDLQTTDDIRALGAESERFVAEIENLHNS